MAGQRHTSTIDQFNFHEWSNGICTHYSRCDHKRQWHVFLPKIGERNWAISLECAWWVNSYVTSFTIVVICVSIWAFALQTAPNITISDRSLIFIRNRGTINLTCTILSVESPDEVTWYYNETSIETDQTQWQSKNRICMSEGIENCLIRTTFNLILKAVDLERSGFYSCATENIQPAKVYVEVLNEPVLLGGDLGSCDDDQIFGYAIEALESYGIQKVWNLALNGEIWIKNHLCHQLIGCRWLYERSMHYAICGSWFPLHSVWREPRILCSQILQWLILEL